MAEREQGLPADSESFMPALVELMTTPAAGLAECVIEFEGRRGEMRIDTREAVICPASLASILTCSAT